MASQKLTLVIEHDTKAIPVESFISVVENTVDLLKCMDIQQSADHKVTSEWRISKVTMRSPLHITFESVPIADRVPSNIVSPFVKDIDRLERGRRPQWFTGAMEDTAKEMVAVYSKGIRNIRFVADHFKATPTARLAEHVDAAASQHFEIGSVEGRLDVINVHKGQKIRIWDDRFGIAVKCNVSTQQLEDAKIYLGTRVSIRGRIKYRRNRPHVVVDVFDIRQLLGSNRAPQPEDIGPVDLTGGMDPIEYLRGDYGGK
jgi:hypothetical protein